VSFQLSGPHGLESRDFHCCLRLGSVVLKAVLLLGTRRTYFSYWCHCHGALPRLQLTPFLFPEAGTISLSLISSFRGSSSVLRLSP
jgi:hypothetical protein